MKRSLLALLVLLPLLQASDTGNRVLYVGGTVAGCRTNPMRARHFSGGRSQADDPQPSVYHSLRDVNSLEYGLRVSRHYMEAVLISPIFLLEKKKTHFLTIEFVDADGKQQAVVLQVSKGRSGRGWSLWKRAPAAASSIRMRMRGRRARNETSAAARCCLASQWRRSGSKRSAMCRNWR